MRDEVRAGNVRVASQLISAIERGDPDAREVMRELYPETGSAQLIGVTGPPGAGKSTLASALCTALRKQDKTVGVVAVDPSSPFSGGALLGDRDRMTATSTDAAVFIRSLAARGAGGGLAAAVNDAVDVMDAMGKDVVLVETVGVGQGELDIARIAHTVILVLVPGYGDQLQAMKAGITEIADVVAVNKADVDGADTTWNTLMAEHFTRRCGDAEWPVPIMKVTARTGVGLDDLIEAIEGHRAWAEASGAREDSERRRRSGQFADRVALRMREQFLDAELGAGALRDRVDAKDIDPYTAAEELVAMLEKEVLRR